MPRQAHQQPSSSPSRPMPAAPASPTKTKGHTHRAHKMATPKPTGPKSGLSFAEEAILKQAGRQGGFPLVEDMSAEELKASIQECHNHGIDKLRALLIAVDMVGAKDLALGKVQLGSEAIPERLNDIIPELFAGISPAVSPVQVVAYLLWAIAMGFEEKELVFRKLPSPVAFEHSVAKRVHDMLEEGAGTEEITRQFADLDTTAQAA